MTVSHRMITGLALVAALVGCDSMELTIAVEPGPEGELSVANAGLKAWSGARLLVESVEPDTSTSVCADRAVATWRPGEAVRVPACGDAIRLTLTTGGETARFSWVNGQLFRRIGRKEVPVKSS